MSFEAPRTIGLVERAAKIALKHGIIYNARWNEFKGDPEAVKKATLELEKWTTNESLKALQARRHY
jgi:hypothetical protein